MSLVERLRCVAKELPPDASITIPVEVLRGLLADEPAGQSAEPALQGNVADLTVAEVAARMRRSPNAVRSWIASGALKAYKLRGKSYRVPCSSLAAFLKGEHARGLPPRDPSNHLKRASDLSAWRTLRQKGRCDREAIPRVPSSVSQKRP